MLKIKDDVDLKELEKFGFYKEHIDKEEFEDEDVEEGYYDYYSLASIEDLTSNSLYARGIIKHLSQKIKKNIRYHGRASIDINGVYARKIIDEGGDWTDFDLLYDLITAGLVEKVKEE